MPNQSVQTLLNQSKRENPNFGTVLLATLADQRVQSNAWLNRPELKSSEISIFKDWIKLPAKQVLIKTLL